MGKISQKWQKTPEKTRHFEQNHHKIHGFCYVVTIVFTEITCMLTKIYNINDLPENGVQNMSNANYSNCLFYP